MKRNILKAANVFVLLALMTTFTGCKKFLGLKRQDSYNYVPQTLDPHINITAKQFLDKRADGPDPADTVLRMMKKGLEYAGIDLAEYEKKDRTFIFLHNDAIRITKTSGGVVSVTGGFFFSYPIVKKDANGDPVLDPVTGAPKTTPAKEWSDYSVETVKNYFLYLIGEGEYNFKDLNNLNKSVKSLLPPGTVAGKESMLGYTNEEKGFDQEGMFNLKLASNNDLAPIVFNDKTNDRSGGYIATNGIIHVFGGVVHPFR